MNIKEKAQYPKTRSGGGEVEPHLGLAPDYVNAWNAISTFLENADTEYADLVFETQKQHLEIPVKHYYDYFVGKYEKDQEYIARIKKESDPAKVAEINALVDQYNSEREEILKTKNWDRLRYFWQKADELIRGHKIETPE